MTGGRRRDDRLGGEAAVEVEGHWRVAWRAAQRDKGSPAAHATISSPVALEYLLPGTKSPFRR